MLSNTVYLVLAGALLAWVLSLLPFRNGRRWLSASLPAAAFFLLLLGTAEAAFRVGQSHGGTGAGASAVVHTCSMHPQVRQEGPGLCPICHMELVPLTAVAADAGPGVTIDPVVVQNMGVRVQPVARGPLVRSVRAFGALRQAQPRQRDIALKFDGFVERLFADTEGMVLAQGAPLFAVYAPELVVAQEELIAARRSGDAELLAAARQKLLLWDLPEERVDELAQRDAAERTLVWSAPVGGTLLRRDVVEGAPAPKNQVLLRLVDLSVLWLDAQVPEAQLGAVQLGQDAVATFPAMPGLELAGKVVFVAPMLDEATRTATVRVELANPDGRLKPGMFARLQLRSTLAEDVVLVPQEAVLDTGLRKVAWLLVGKGRFESRELALGPVGDGGVVQVLKGLQPGEHVVLSGQFLIDAESRMREGTRKLQDEGLTEGGDVPPPAPLDLPAELQQQADALLAANVRVSAAFAADKHDAEAWSAMTTAATALATAADVELQHRAGELAAQLQRATGDVPALRLAYKQISIAAVRVFELARPRGAAGTSLYVHHCPMVEADWVQLDDKTQNPYDTSMLQCGEVRRTLPLRAPQDGPKPEGGR